MARITVIGFGNTLRGDDALGPMAAELVAQRFDAASVEVIVRHTLTPELAGTLSETEYALFIDASSVGSEGEVQERVLAPDPNSDVALVHFLEPAALMTWTQQLYGRAPPALLISVLAGNLDFGEQLSPGMERMLPRVVDRATSLLREQLQRLGEGEDVRQ